MNVAESEQGSGQTKTMFDLSGRVAIVTGGASGLGRVFCQTLAEFGADIVIADIDEAGAQETAGMVDALGRRSLVVRTDVRDPDEIDNMVRETTGKLGTVDILINNAGITAKAARIGDMAIEDWDRVIATDLRGVFLCTRAVLPVMVRQKRGNIINNASIYGVRVLFEMAATNANAHYSAAKAGVVSLTKEAAVEYARDGIRVNCIAPGFHGGTKLSAWIRVPGQEERHAKFEETILRITPMGRRGTAAELRGLIVFLASDASSFVTGQVFASDGGICT
jgi:NAD(P)-dependent dehydrogenase (short-subunit alcohol dehydrogenase family)